MNDKLRTLIVIWISISSFFILVQGHEDSHERNFINTGCEGIERTLFSVSAKYCPDVELTDKLNTMLEFQYMHIWAYWMIITLLGIIALRRY